MSEEKDKIISDIYYEESGYGSVITTYHDSKLKDKTITLKYVKDWFDRRIEKTKQPRGTNSFVAPYPFYEFQIDLFFINYIDKQKHKIGMVCIDIFTKFAVVVSLASKKEGDLAAGIMECINKMGKKPEIIYTDDEGALHTKAIQEYFKEKNISHYITRNHAWFAERFIRTFKNLLSIRIENTKEENPQWTDYIFQIMLTYNNKMVHTATRMTPQNALKPSNELDVKANMEIIAKHTKKYPNLKVGDTIRILRKKELGEKEHVSSFSKESYKITTMFIQFEQTYYKVEGKTRDYLRSELLKI